MHAIQEFERLEAMHDTSFAETDSVNFESVVSFLLVTHEEPETFIRLRDGFKARDALFRADALKECVAFFTAAYEAALHEMRNESKAARQRGRRERAKANERA